MREREEREEQLQKKGIRDGTGTSYHGRHTIRQKRWHKEKGEGDETELLLTMCPKSMGRCILAC